jgi:integrase
LSQRNGLFYGAVWKTTASGKKSCRRFLLKNANGSKVTSIRQARESYNRLKVSHFNQSPIVAATTPTLSEFAHVYLQSPATLAKGKRTIEKESQCLGIWKALFGHQKLDRIDTAIILEFIDVRLAGRTIDKKYYAPVSLRTSAIDLIVLRNLMKTALDRGAIRQIPRFPKIKAPSPPRRELVSDHNFQRLIAGCSEAKPCGEPITKNGSQLADLLKLLDFCGARETEAYALAWHHVDFIGKKLWIGVGEEFHASMITIGTGGNSKNRKSRSVDMSSSLEAHLQSMQGRRCANSQWLFPSPKRGSMDRSVISLRESLNLVKNHLGITNFGFHDCRHRFASRCVMSGVDYMTIAKWLGHQDGGILVGKVYGHLSDEHQKNMARLL